MEFKLKNIDNVLLVTKIANVHFFEFEKDFKTKTDSHSFSELLFSYSGTMIVEAENYRGKLRKGEMIIHRANERHALWAPQNNKNSAVIIGFQCNSEILDYFSKRPVRLDEIEKKELARIVKEGRNVFSGPYGIPVYDMKKKEKQIFGSEQMLRSLIETFLIELIRKHIHGDEVKKDEKRNERFEEIKTYVDSHFADKLKLDEIAFLFNLNRSAFCSMFKENTGKTFIEYVAEKKIEAVKERLSATKDSLTEIALSLGFGSSAYLCRSFRAKTGMTPKQYRQKYVK
jgi:AraC-like DNA-binding protein